MLILKGAIYIEKCFLKKKTLTFSPFSSVQVFFFKPFKKYIRYITETLKVIYLRLNYEQTRQEIHVCPEFLDWSKQFSI